MAAAPRRFADIFAGGIIGVAAVGTLVMIMHHPVLGHTPTAEAATAGIRRLASLDRMVHGVILGLMGLMTLGFLHLTQRLGFGRPAPAAGFVAFAAGALFTGMAAVFDGFIIPDLGEHCAQTGVDAAACSQTALDLLRLCAVAVQEFTKVGLVAMSLGIAFWGVAFLHRRDPKGVLGLALGLAGLAAGLAPAAMIVFAPFRLSPHKLLMVFAAQAVWYLAVAAFLIFARRPAENAEA